MIQISTIVFSLMIELIVVLIAVLGVWVVLTLKRRKKDRAAVAKLVEQVRHQSELRLKETGSYLEEKYQFEGDELKKAIQMIDKAEKKFIQKTINMYLNREAHELEVMDASLAELIENYKALKPLGEEQNDAKEIEAVEEEAVKQELDNLRKSNQQLTEELAITKQTMGNMIAEFGNMFGGGQESSLEKEEVLEKVNVTAEEDEADELVTDEPAEQETPVVEQEEIVMPEDEDVSPDAQATDQPATAKGSQQPDENKAEEKAKKNNDPDALLDFDEGIDELMDGIDLSDDV